MRNFLLVLAALLVGMPLIWYGALKSERLKALRGVAQLVYLPGDFFAAGASLPLSQTDAKRHEVDFDFIPKYAGRYQILVKPILKKYGATIDANSVLTCEADAHQFEVSGHGGRVEFDTALKLGFTGRLLTFDTGNNAKVGTNYRCKLTIDTAQELFLQQAYVRKLTDV